MTTVFEKELERNHRILATRSGWFVDKIMRTSRNGFPDRFYARHGRVVLMEWKRLGGRISPQQKLRHKQLREAGVEVYVVDNLEEANRILGIGNANQRDL